MRTELPEIVDKPFSGTVPSELGLLAVTDVVVFPGVILPYVVSEPKQVRMVHSVLGANRMLAVFLKRDTGQENRLYGMGTAVQVLKMFSVPDGSVGLLLQGVSRVRYAGIASREPFVSIRVESHVDDQRSSIKTEGYRKALLRAFDQYAEQNGWIGEDMLQSIRAIKEPGRLSDVICANLNFNLEDRQAVLEEADNIPRMKNVLQFINRENQLAELSRKIQDELNLAMEKNQKEYYLREQLKVIRKELGEEDDAQVELDELRVQLDEGDYPEAVCQAAEREIRRLRRMSQNSSEFSVSRTYVDWLVNFPWRVMQADHTDVARARRILDRDHFGLEQIKERILEFLAVRKLSGNGGRGPILCFVGPPGVGKTSLGMSIAESLGRSFVRLALGGVHDESEVRGHRRTYVGAMPGRIVQKLREAGNVNPVFMLDEIDKLGADVKGDPSAAMLEVLDPAQNHTFQDHYLDVAVDLSQTLFVATANQAEQIPGPLRDRMEVIHLPGYLPTEKLEIARRYLAPRQIESNGLKKSRLSFTAAGLRTIIEEYTREAGVRQLEQRIGAVARKVARRVAEGEGGKVSVTARTARELLGAQRILPEVAGRRPEVGVATGLAWTPFGGVLLFIEATAMRGSGKLHLTGHLGDVMRESGEIALSYIRARGKDLGIAADFHEQTDLHVHLPEGATPKDGPSAGITIVAALVSLLSGRPVKHDTAMTGEVSLRGRVLAIGGLREKVMAAHRAGIRSVLAPADNEKDLEEIPAEIRGSMRIVLVSHIDEVLKHTLMKKPR